MPTFALGKILALVVLVICVVALALVVLSKDADVPAWLFVALVGILAVARLDHA